VYLYQNLNWDLTTNKVAGFTAAADGTLTPIAGSPWDIPGQTGAWNLVPGAAGTRHFLYVTNSSSNTISAYRVDAKQHGALVEIAGSPFSSVNGIPGALRVSRDGRFLYAATGWSPGAVEVFTIDPATGALAPASAVTALAANLCMDPTGTRLYTIGALNLTGFHVNTTTGALTPFQTFSAVIDDCVVTPDGRYLYATSGFWHLVFRYAIDPTTGVLTDKTTFANATDAQPAHLLVNQAGTKLYVTGIDTTTNTSVITIYDIASDTGALTEAAGSPVATPAWPAFMATDPHERVLFLSADWFYFGTGAKTAWFTIGANGGLTPGSASPYSFGNQYRNGTLVVFSDQDGDGWFDDEDDCPTVADPDQADTDGDGEGDACEPAPSCGDADGDGVPDGCDLCPTVPDPNQADFDEDDVGDACDAPDLAGAVRSAAAAMAGRNGRRAERVRGRLVVGLEARATLKNVVLALRGIVKMRAGDTVGYPLAQQALYHVRDAIVAAARSCREARCAKVLARARRLFDAARGSFANGDYAGAGRSAARAYRLVMRTAKSPSLPPQSPGALPPGGPDPDCPCDDSPSDSPSGAFLDATVVR